jgi:drug/metabolite transporter (DMT)-like permease
LTLHPQRRAEVLLFLITFVWGSTFVITKGLLEQNSPLWYTSIRFGFASLITFIVFHRKLLHYSPTTLWRGFVLGLFLLGGFLAQTIGIQYTTASKSAFFTGFLTILTPVFQFLFYRWKHRTPRPITSGNIIGVLLATFGLYMLTSPEGSAFNRGDFLSICCAVLFACYIVYLDYVSDEPQKVQLAFIQFVLCAIGGAVAGLLFENIHIVWSTGYIVSLAYLTIFATVITMMIQIRFQGDTTPTRTAIIFAMEPVIAGILAYFIRNENIGALGILGGFLIVLGLLSSELSDMISFLRKEVIRS